MDRIKTTSVYSFEIALFNVYLRVIDHLRRVQEITTLIIRLSLSLFLRLLVILVLVKYLIVVLFIENVARDVFVGNRIIDQKNR